MSNLISWNSFAVEVGDAANYMYDNSGTWQTAMDHPYAPAVIGATPLAVYGAVTAAPAIVSGATELLSSPAAAPLIRSAGIGAAGGLVGQAGSDALNSIASGSLQISSGKEYFNSTVEGAIGGATNLKFGIWAAGGAVGLSDYALNKVEKNNPSVTSSAGKAVTTIVGGKLVNSASGIPGRLPNPGTANYYLGRHAQQLGFGELGQNAVSSVSSLFDPKKK